MQVLASPRYGLWLPLSEDSDASLDLPTPSGMLAFTHPVAQRTETLCFVVANNLHRLVVLELAEGVRVQFHRAAAIRGS